MSANDTNRNPKFFAYLYIRIWNQLSEHNYFDYVKDIESLDEDKLEEKYPVARNFFISWQLKEAMNMGALGYGLSDEQVSLFFVLCDHATIDICQAMNQRLQTFDDPARQGKHFSDNIVYYINECCQEHYDREKFAEAKLSEFIVDDMVDKINQVLDNLE